MVSFIGKLCSKTTQVVLLFPLLVWATDGFVRAQSHRSVSELVEQLKESWKRASAHEHVNQSYEFEVQMVSSVSGSNPEKWSKSGKVFIRDSRRAVVRSDSVYAKNESYSFLIGRDGPDRGWKLSALSIYPDEKVDTLALGAPHHFLLFHPRTGFFGSSSHSLLDEGRLTFQSVRSEATGRVKVEFRARIPLGSREDDLTGVMTLNPEKNWLIVECEFTTPNGIDKASRGSMRRELLDDRGAPGRIVTKSIHTEIHRSVGSQTTSIELGNHSTMPSPDGIFRLSHYDLPEVVGIENESTNRRWMWILVLGLSCFGAGIGFYLLARRTKALGA